MRSSRWTAAALLCAAAALVASRPAAAQDDTLYRVGITGGVGGSLDSDADNSLDHDALQVSFGFATDDRTLISVRAARIELGDPDFEGLADAELEFANIAGEYRFGQGYYDFGVYLGLGAYRLSGEVAGGEEKETALGLGLGLVGDFDLTRHLALTVETSAHYAFFDERSQIYAAAMGGVAIRF